MPDTDKSIINWFETAKPKPTLEDLCVQIGCHLEKVAEMLTALKLSVAYLKISHLATEFKHKTPYAMSKLEDISCLKNVNSVEFIDSIADQHVTGLGVLKFLKELKITNSDLEIIAEVNESNWSKFDEEGQPYFDANGKIRKGPDYFKPDLNQFINSTGE